MVNNKKRKKILKTILQNGGLCRKELVLCSGVDPKTFDVHTRLLESEGYIITRKEGRNKIYQINNKIKSVRE